MLPTVPAVEPPSVQMLQDVLYDILAVGVDSDASASTTGAIETFLHEHARSPKPREAFVAFFRAQGLSWSQARSVAVEPQALPPLRLVPPSTPRPIDPDAVQPGEPPQLAVPDHVGAEAFVAHTPSVAARRSWAPWAALALVATLIGGAFGFGYRELEALTSQLGAAQAQNRAQAEALGQLQQRLAEVQSGAAASAERIERVESQNTLLLESLLPAAPAE
jgi:hypothetical protein